MFYQIINFFEFQSNFPQAKCMQCLNVSTSCDKVEFVLNKTHFHEYWSFTHKQDGKMFYYIIHNMKCRKVGNVRGLKYVDHGKKKKNRWMSKTKTKEICTKNLFTT